MKAAGSDFAGEMVVSVIGSIAFASDRADSLQEFSNGNNENASAARIKFVVNIGCT